jgi:hypothetical protein
MSKTQTNDQVVPQQELKFDPAQLSALTTTSAKIRYLDSCGLKRGEIATTLGKRYQHVRNVLITPIKKSS